MVIPRYSINHLGKLCFRRPGNVVLQLEDGMRRVEVRNASSGIHLGHVFDNGPLPTDKRYCIDGNGREIVADTAAK